MRQSVCATLALLGVAYGWQWDQPSSSGNRPSAREGHALITWQVRAGTTPRLLVSGGEDSTGTAQPGIWSLDPLGWSWTRLMSNTEVEPRVDHTAVLAGSYMIMYGGLQNGSTADPAGCEVVEVGSWTPQPAKTCGGDVPPPRYAHSAAVTANGQQWIVFGGAAYDTGAELDDVAVLDLGGSFSSNSVNWTRPVLATGSDRPLPRYYHAAAVFGDRMVVFGGMTTVNGTMLVLNDVWFLSLGPVWRWTQDKAATGTATYGHRMVTVNSYILCFGGHNAPATGVRYLDMSRSPPGWGSPAVEGTWSNTPMRAGAAVFDANGDADPELVVFGGAATQQDNAGAAAAGTRLLASPLPVADGLSVLSEIGENPGYVAEELPVILGGAAVGTFVLAGLGYFSYRRAVRAAAAARMAGYSTIKGSAESAALAGASAASARIALSSVGAGGSGSGAGSGGSSGGGYGGYGGYQDTVDGDVDGLDGDEYDDIGNSSSTSSSAAGRRGGGGTSSSSSRGRGLLEGEEGDDDGEERLNF